MKKLMCLLTALTLALSVPMVSSASDTIVNSPIECDGDVSLRIYDKDWGWIDGFDYEIGSYYNLTYPVDSRIAYVPVINLMDCLTEAQKYLLVSSVNTTMKATYTLEYFSDPSYSDYVFYTRLFCDTDSKDRREMSSGQSYTIPNNVAWTAELGDYFYNENMTQFQLELFSNVYYSSARNYDMQFVLKSLSIVITTVGADKSTADIVINMGKIEDSLNQGFDNMGDKLDGVQDSINQGFDNVLKPNASDKAQSDKFGSDMSNKVEQGAGVLDQMGQMQKPDIDSVMPDDLLSDNEADAMITLMDTVQPVLASALIGRTLLIGLILALIAFIIYGKR